MKNVSMLNFNFVDLCIEGYKAVDSLQTREAITIDRDYIGCVFEKSIIELCG